MSLLLRVLSGQKDHNEEGVLPKYQLNPMLCPRFDLPISRRGTVSLKPVEVEAIFGEATEQFDSLLADRLLGMNAPFVRAKRRKSGNESFGQERLPGLR
jgi:hypothetical protein